MRAKSTTPPRPKSPAIHTIPEDAPWVLLSKAAADSGLTELLIRRENLPTRKFGNAHYIQPKDLNAWILQDAPTANATNKNAAALCGKVLRHRMHKPKATNPGSTASHLGHQNSPAPASTPASIPSALIATKIACMKPKTHPPEKFFKFRARQ
jgi:hypothetical protein